MCLAREALDDSNASPSCNGCPSREGLCETSLIRIEDDGAPENSENLSAAGISSSTRSRSYYCWYRRSSRKICSTFRRSSAKVLPEVTEDAEIDFIETGSPQQDDVMGLEGTTAPNSPASGYKTDQDKATKAGRRSWLGRFLLLYSGKPKITPTV